MFITFIIVNILRYNYTIHMFIFAYLIYFFLEITGMWASLAQWEGLTGIAFLLPAPLGVGTGHVDLFAYQLQSGMTSLSQQLLTYRNHVCL